MLVREIVVVDDCKEWRRIVCSMLQTRPELSIIAEATDGAEAVQNAEELKPDLVLLDIGLPRLNGINAAEQIFEVSPASKILFLSGIDDPDVMQVALRSGASGYVCKHNAGTELLPAVLAALDGSPRKNAEALDRSALSAFAKPEEIVGQADRPEGIQPEFVV